MAAEKIYRIVGDLKVSPSVSEIEVALLVLRVVKAVGSSRANEARPDFSSGLLSRKLKVVAKLVE